MIAKVVFYTLGILFYIFVAAAFLHDRLNHPTHISARLVFVTRKAMPKDIWISALWPVLLMWISVRSVAAIIHTTIAYALLLVGVQYVNSEKCKRIDKKLWGL